MNIEIDNAIEIAEKSDIWLSWAELRCFAQTMMRPPG